MLSFKSFLAEKYKNFIGPSSNEVRLKYVDQVWDVLQKSYAAIGGIKGNGFKNKQDMIDNIPFWKIFTRGDRVVAAVMYKDKGGRKAVAIGTDGSDDGKKVVADVYKADLKTSYGEKSGPALGYLVKTVGADHVANFMLPPEMVTKLTGDECIPVEKFGVDKLDPADKRTWDKFPELRPFFYVRELGGEWHMKATAGTPNLKIFRN